MNNIVDQARRRHTQRLFVIPGVVWVGIGIKRTGGRATGEPAVVVGVVKKRRLSEIPPSQLIPERLRHSVWAVRKQVKTDVVESGGIRALTAWTDRWRPAPCGVSVGHVNITAGTLGMIVRRHGQRMILSNNHVLANSNAGQIGDEILQPGAYDSGRAGPDTLAELEAFVPITFDGAAPPPPPDRCPTAHAVTMILNLICQAIKSQTRYVAVDAVEATPNYVDAAVARPRADGDLDAHLLNPVGKPTILVPTATRPAELGLAVRKSGRTTNWTEGQVTAVQVTVRVQYGEGQTATFEDQVVVELAGFSAGGDSGSAILSDDGRLVGLLFAGSDQQTIFNRVERVFEALDLSL